MHNTRQEKEMRQAFGEQAQKIISSPERFRKRGNALRVGIESEVAIFSEKIALADLEGARNAILQEVPECTDIELGAAQIELRTPPVDILGTGGFAELQTVYEKSALSLLRAARKHGAKILRAGSNPFLPIKNTPRTDKLKYRLVPDYYNAHRPKNVDTHIGLGKHRVDIGDAAIVSLFQSFQVNMEALSFDDACNTMNRSFMIAPYLMGLAANARYLQCLNTGVQDMRLLAWEKSHDTRMHDVRLLSWEKAFDLRTEKDLRAGCILRVGLPERYFRNITEYLARAGSFPFILHQPDSALAIAIGMTWLDTRVKIIGDSLVVELRLLPTQPTIAEELMLTLLYVGRLAYAQKQSEPLLPIECVRENRLSAMLYGMHRSMWFLPDDGAPRRLAYKIGMRKEIQKAKQGLCRLGLSKHLDAGLLEFILASGSPSDRLARSLRKMGGNGLHARMKKALQETCMLI